MTYAGLVLRLICCWIGSDTGDRLLGAKGEPQQPATSVSLQGLAAPSQRVELGFANPGILVDQKAEVGARIEQGEVMAELDSRIQEAEIRFSRVKVKYPYELKAAEIEEAAKKDILVRLQTLVEREAAGEWELRKAESDYALAQARTGAEKVRLAIHREELKRNETLLAQRQVRSPFAGTVAKVLRDPGEAVDALQPVIVLVRLDPLMVEVNVPSEHAGRVLVGQQAKVKLMNETRPATVSDIEPVVDSGSMTFRVRLAVANPDRRLVAGLPATAVIPLADRGAQVSKGRSEDALPESQR